MNEMTALKRAIQVAGSMRQLGEQIDCSTHQIGMWRYRRRIPAEYVLSIEKATGVSRHELRPDIYPTENP